jgi:insecticidal toxin complex protein TccC
MKRTSSLGVHARTPQIQSFDSRGSTIRTMSYYRSATADIAQVQVTRHAYDNTGRLCRSIDPRLHEPSRTQPETRPNLGQRHSLSGQLIRSDSVDAGTSIWLHDGLKRVALSVTPGNTFEARDYDSESGRLSALATHSPGADPTVVQRFFWGDNSPDSRGRNLAGQCVRHYHQAGLTSLQAASITGLALDSSRRLLKDDQGPGWDADCESEWAERLDVGQYSTQASFDAVGAPVTMTDAKGNRQRMSYDVSGRTLQTWMKAAGQAREQVIIKAASYTAAGMMSVEEHGNGVVVRNRYDEATQALNSAHIGYLDGRRDLRDLRYEYDPVGNLLAITNMAHATQFWRNQKVEPQQTYTYDSLYRLTQATGREMANARRSSRTLPAAGPTVTDDVTYTNYARTYLYDTANNLLQIRHLAAASGNNHTLDMVVSDRSNRALPSSWNVGSANIDDHFTPGGHQRSLHIGQSLVWDERGVLVAVESSAGRAESISEWYRYDQPGSRVLKITNGVADSSRQHRVHYLPGLEARERLEGGVRTSSLHVITCAGTDVKVSLLKWEAGLPSGVENDQYRYLYGDMTGNVGLELDGQGIIVSEEEYYPFGGTAWMAGRSQVEVNYRTIRYSGKERDATGLYYYGYRYYQTWSGRWLSADPAGNIDGLNLYAMVRNNPVSLRDANGLMGQSIKERIAALRISNEGSGSTARAGTGTAPAPRPELPPRPVPRPAITPTVSTVVEPAAPLAAASSAQPAAGTSASTPAASAKKHFTLYRADNRTWDEMAQKFPEGFKAWVPLSGQQSRQMTKAFVGQKETAGLPRDLVGNMDKWGAKPKLSDLSTYIKYTKDRTTVWVSTAVNTEAGGQSSDAPLYEINMDLYEFKVVKEQLVPLPGGRQKNMEPSLLLDTQDLESANVIALNHGPVNDAEISFLTRIPFETMKPYTRS